MIKQLIVFFGLACLLWNGVSRADTFTSKFGFEVEGVKLGNSGYGYLGGISSLTYLGNTPLSIGLAGFFGTPNGGDLQHNYMGMLGVPLHIDGHLSKVVFYDLSVMAAYSESAETGANLFTTGWVLQETLGFGLSLGAGWRISLNPGYLYNFKESNFTGFTFGLMLEHKTAGSSNGKDD